MHDGVGAWGMHADRILTVDHDGLDVLLHCGIKKVQIPEKMVCSASRNAEHSNE